MAVGVRMYESKCKCLTWLKKKKIQKNVELKNNFTLLLLSRGTVVFFSHFPKYVGKKMLCVNCYCISTSSVTLADNWLHLISWSTCFHRGKKKSLIYSWFILCSGVIRSILWGLDQRRLLSFSISICSSQVMSFVPIKNDEQWFMMWACAQTKRWIPCFFFLSQPIQVTWCSGYTTERIKYRFITLLLK